MAQQVRLDLLLKEIEDPYVQENFRKLKRYLDCLDLGNQLGVPGPAGPPGTPGAPGQDSTPDEKLMNVLATVNVGDAVFQDYTQVNFARTFPNNDSPSPFIGVVIEKPTTTTAVVQLQGLISTALPQGTVFMSLTGDFQIGYPASGKWQRMGYSFGDGTMWLEPEKRRIRCP